MKNLILIGMPGCGKSTIGRKLAKRLDLEFIDLDLMIEKTYGKKISDIFKEIGEKGFRQLESKALSESVKTEDRVIATGGGIVIVDGNLSIAENGITVFVDRPLECISSDIKTGNRPLLAGSGAEKLKKLYNERYDKYLSWANIHIINDKTAADAVEKILSEVKLYENNGN